MTAAFLLGVLVGAVGLSLVLLVLGAARAASDADDHAERVIPGAIPQPVPAQLRRAPYDQEAGR